MSFKKGDLVVGKSGTQGEYNYFGEFCIAEVDSVDNSDRIVLVEIISDEANPDNIGESEWVDIKHLVLKDSVSSSSTNFESPITKSNISIPGTKIEYNGSKVDIFKAKGLI